MILSTEFKLPVGKVVYLEMTDTNGVPVKEKVPCLILRRATREEYEKFFLEKWPIERLIKTKGYNANYFEYSTD